MACGVGFSEIHTLDSGRTAKQTVMVCTSGRTATDTKEAGSIALSMAKDPIFLQTAMSTPAITLLARQTAKVSINGKTAVCIKENSKKA